MKTYNQFLENAAMLRFGYKPGRSFSLGGEGASNNASAGLNITRYAAGREATPTTVSQGVAQASKNLGQTGETSRAVGPRTGVSGYANLSGAVNSQASKPQQTSQSTPPKPPSKTSSKPPVRPTSTSASTPVRPVRPVEPTRPVEPVRPMGTTTPTMPGVRPTGTRPRF